MLSQGPYSPISRNESQLGRLVVGGIPLYTNTYKWTPWSFLRRATVIPETGAAVMVETEVAMPLTGVSSKLYDPNSNLNQTVTYSVVILELVVQHWWRHWTGLTWYWIGLTCLT